MTDLTTPLCRTLVIVKPILQAPIATSTKLAVTVSQAGSLGILPITWRSTDNVKKAVAKLQAATDEPFGVNVVLSLVEAEQHANLNAALDVVIVEGSDIGLRDLDALGVVHYAAFDCCCERAAPRLVAAASIPPLLRAISRATRLVSMTARMPRTIGALAWPIWEEGLAGKFRSDIDAHDDTAMLLAELQQRCGIDPVHPRGGDGIGAFRIFHDIHF